MRTARRRSAPAGLLSLPDKVLLRIGRLLLIRRAEREVASKDLFALSCVSSRLNGVLSHSSELWRTLTIKEYSCRGAEREKAFRRSVRAWLQSHSGHVMNVVVDSVDLVLPLQVLARNSSSLQSFTWNQEFTPYAPGGIEHDYQPLFDRLSRCPQLAVARFSSLGSVGPLDSRSTHLRGMTRLSALRELELPNTRLDANQLVQCLPRLASLTTYWSFAWGSLNPLSSLTGLTSLQLGHSGGRLGSPSCSPGYDSEDYDSEDEGLMKPVAGAAKDLMETKADFGFLAALPKLESLSLYNFNKLETLHLCGLLSLSSLHLRSMDSLRAFSGLFDVPLLQSVRLQVWGVSSLCKSLVPLGAQLTKLILDIPGEVFMPRIPKELASFSALERLEINFEDRHCNGGVTLPENFGSLTSLTHLDLGGCTLEALPVAYLLGLTNLKELHLDGDALDYQVSESDLAALSNALPDLRLNGSGPPFGEEEMSDSD